MAKPPLLIATGFAVCVLACGCGGSKFPTATVEGSVSVNGQPVAEGIISFVPLEVREAKEAVAEIRDGKYRATGVLQGRVLVRFQAVKETGRVIHDPVEGSGPEKVSIIPPQYEKGIELTIKSSKETHDFDLRWR